MEEVCNRRCFPEALRERASRSSETPSPQFDITPLRLCSPSGLFRTPSTGHSPWVFVWATIQRAKGEVEVLSLAVYSTRIGVASAMTSPVSSGYHEAVEVGRVPPVLGLGLFVSPAFFDQRARAMRSVPIAEIFDFGLTTMQCASGHRLPPSMPLGRRSGVKPMSLSFEASPVLLLLLWVPKTWKPKE